MWSVFTAPCLVATVVPSISGRRSRCTPRADVGAAAAFAGADLVDLVQEDDAVLLDLCEGVPHDGVVVEQFVGLRRDQRFVRLATVMRWPWCAGLAEDVGDVYHADRGAGHAGSSNIGDPTALRQFELDFFVVELSCVQLAGKGSRVAAEASRRPARQAPALPRELRLRLDVLALAALDRAMAASISRGRSARRRARRSRPR